MLETHSTRLGILYGFCQDGQMAASAKYWQMAAF